MLYSSRQIPLGYGDITNWCQDSNSIDQTSKVTLWMNSGAVLTIPAGFTFASAPQALPQYQYSGFSLLGAGVTSNAISTEGGDWLQLPCTGQVSRYNIGNFMVTGQGITTGAGYALNIQAGTPGLDPYDMNIHDIFTQGMGGGCIKDAHGIFSSTYRRCVSLGDGGNNFDFMGGNTTAAIDCYGFGAPALNHITGYANATYRIHGSMQLVRPNGLNSGAVWGIFGDSTSNLILPSGVTAGAMTVQAGSAIRYPLVTIDGGNIEAFNGFGVVMVNGSVQLVGGTAITSAPSSTTVALYGAGAVLLGKRGLIENMGLIQLGAGASWLAGGSGGPAAIWQGSFGADGMLFNSIGSPDSETHAAGVGVPIYSIGDGFVAPFSTSSAAALGYDANDQYRISQFELARAVQQFVKLANGAAPTLTSPGILGEQELPSGNAWNCTVAGSGSGTWTETPHA